MGDAALMCRGLIVEHLDGGLAGRGRGSAVASLQTAQVMFDTPEMVGDAVEPAHGIEAGAGGFVLQASGCAPQQNAIAIGLALAAEQAAHAVELRLVFLVVRRV